MPVLVITASKLRVYAVCGGWSMLARGRPITLPYRDYIRLPIHVDDIAEVFVRVLLADVLRYHIYNSGGTPISLGELADTVQELLPDAHVGFEHHEGGNERSGTYLVDNSRLL